MSIHETTDSMSREGIGTAVDRLIVAQQIDLGGFTVRRILPAADHKQVGPFIFFDHLGPSTFAPGTGIDVRPHPHIGLSTLTYVFTGKILHRDSLGCVQTIEPGAVNWMTAGKGVVHSERTPEELRAAGFDMHGIQCWIALPDGHEEVEPSFAHHPADALPVIRRSDIVLRLIAGEAYGQQSPVQTFSSLFYAHAEAQPGADIPLPARYPERAIYIVSGELNVAGTRYGQHQMIVLSQGAAPAIVARLPSRLMLLGGAALESERTVWWNFSSSSQGRIEAAKDDWKNGRFGQIPGETEFIPLPDE